MATTTTLDWYGCATFRLQTAGLVVFLDAYIDRIPSAAGFGRSAADITECDWILIGHSHFDHLYGAATIMANTGATLIGSYETVRMMEAAGADPARLIAVAGGEKLDLGNGVTASAYPSLHSCVWSQGAMAPADQECLGDIGVTWQDQQARLAELTQRLSSTLEVAAIEHLINGSVGHSPRGDGGALVFHIVTPDGSLLYQDTSGHWTGVVDLLRPDAAIIAAAGRANIDGQPIQGRLADFVADHAARCGARTVVLSHHDDWLPGFSIPTDITPIRDALAERCPGTVLLDLGYVDGTELFAAPAATD